MTQSSRPPRAKKPFRVDLPWRGWSFEIHGQHALWINTAGKTDLWVEFVLAALMVPLVIAMTVVLGLFIALFLAILPSTDGFAQDRWSMFTFWEQSWFWVAVGLINLFALTSFFKPRIGRIVTRFEFDREKERVIIERKSLHLPILTPVLKVIAFAHIAELACEVLGEDAAQFRLRVRVPNDAAYTVSLGPALPLALCREQLAWLHPALGDRLCMRAAPPPNGRPGAEVFRFPPVEQASPEPNAHLTAPHPDRPVSNTDRTP